MPVRSMTPSGKDKAHTITYPPNCKELHEDLGKDELIRRLKVMFISLQAREVTLFYVYIILMFLIL